MLTGRLHPYLPELTIRDYDTYLRYVRGVSYQLYLEYGFLAYQLPAPPGAAPWPCWPTAWRGGRPPAGASGCRGACRRCR